MQKDTTYRFVYQINAFPLNPQCQIHYIDCFKKCATIVIYDPIIQPFNHVTTIKEDLISSLRPWHGNRRHLLAHFESELQYFL